MKRIKLFESFENSSDVWKVIGPNWLFDYVMSNAGSNDPAEENGLLTMAHSELDIAIIFFLHKGEIRWTWSWGNGDYQGMVDYEISNGESKSLGVTGDTPKDFVKNIDDKIREIEDARAKK